MEFQFAAARVIAIGPATIDNTTQAVAVSALRHVDAKMRPDSAVDGGDLVFAEIRDPQAAQQREPPTGGELPFEKQTGGGQALADGMPPR